MQTPYFNETGPIYQQEHVQAKEFVKLVRSHVVAETTSASGDVSPGKEIVWFDWEAFRAAVASLQASDLSAEHNFTVTIPTPSNDDIEETTIQAVLDALIASFTSAFTNVLFIDGGENPKSHFFDTLRKNLYHAFTRHLKASDATERYLGFLGQTHVVGGIARSAWEYRLLFAHPDSRLAAVRGLVMTVRLEGSFDKEANEERAWHGVSLHSKGPFSGTLRAMQIVIGDGFRCP